LAAAILRRTYILSNCADLRPRTQFEWDQSEPCHGNSAAVRHRARPPIAACRLLGFPLGEGSRPQDPDRDVSQVQRDRRRKSSTRTSAADRDAASEWKRPALPSADRDVVKVVANAADARRSTKKKTHPRPAFGWPSFAVSDRTKRHATKIIVRRLARRTKSSGPMQVYPTLMAASRSTTKHRAGRLDGEMQNFLDWASARLVPTRGHQGSARASVFVRLPSR